jgi:ATP:ADP antiporter, AAA family
VSHLADDLLPAYSPPRTSRACGAHHPPGTENVATTEKAGFRETIRELVGLPDDRETRIAVFSMMGLYFLIVLTLGILRSVRNSMALDGLGEGDFYQVYLVSALVILFVPLVNRLSNRLPWRRLIPAVAFFFALNLILFRAVYVEGSTLFGLVFYGWYDLLAASLVTQFFMVAQLFFHARLAKHAFPVIIAGGSLGATLGGVISGLFAERLGTPNLLLVAAGPILLFSLAVPFVWARTRPDQGKPPPRKQRGDGREGKGQLGAIIRNRQVQLIAGLVLVTILVKQIVDYQFNTITKVVYVDLDAVTSIQGWFNAATQWLPLVALAGMKPLLRRWGVGLIVLILPVAMLSVNAALLVFWGIWAAFIAKGAETSIRYSVDRAGREILYVPVPDEIKLKAKNYIDAALEKGVGKIASALVIFVVVGLAGLEYQQVAWVGVGLAAIWIFMAIRVKKEYARSLATSVENRFASLRGAFASLSDPDTLEVVRTALRGDEREAAFALDLLDESSSGEVAPLAEELQDLLASPVPEIRRRALALLGRIRSTGDEEPVRARLLDPEPRVREAAVRALHSRAGDDGPGMVRELLSSERAEVRAATLICLAGGDLGMDEEATREELLRHAGMEGKWADGAGRPGAGVTDLTPDERIERALVASALQPPGAVETLDHLIGDPDPRVASAALRSAGMLGDPELHPRLVAALGRRETREAARDALAALGESGVPVLIWSLLDEQEDPSVRRQIPTVLARIPTPETVPALVQAILAPETEQLLDHRSVKALSKLRARNPDLKFEKDEVDRLMAHSLDACARYAALRTALDHAVPGLSQGAQSGSAGDPPPLPVRLLRQAVEEAWEERREEVFRALGLRFPPDDIHRCYLALTRGEQAPRANALEWLESTLGFHLFRRLAPVMGETPTNGRGAPAPRELDGLLEELAGEQDRWIAHLALRTREALGLSPSAVPDPYARDPEGSRTMNLVETVFLLQQIDILRGARSDHLALLAGIAEEVDVDAGAVLLREGEPAEGLWVVVRGKVALKGAGGDLVLADGKAFGTWALVDDMPSVVEATAVEPTRLLRIGREEYHDLLADHPELAIGMLQGLARRIRSLVA